MTYSNDGQSFYIKSIAITSRLGLTAAGEEPELKRYTLEYNVTAPDYSTGQHWFDEVAAAIDKGAASPRRFLSSIKVTTGTSTQPLYTFKYHQVNTATSSLPPPGATSKDYWGYSNANGAKTLIPQLYVYPQLTSALPLRPAAPYRLFEAPELSSGGLVLTGADRRPAVDFNVALAGTLTEMTFTGGGKVLFDYEPHRFYDPVAKLSLPAGGVRLRSLRAQDPVTKVESRRDYSYQEGDGTASGVLLHAPRFAFAVPTPASAPGWANATVRCGEDLGVDPFESRAIGYRRVVEKVPGKGQVVTVFDVAGAADEATVSATTACVGWQRPLVGFARQAGSTGCPAVTPVQPGTELYPFPTAPNYAFRRGTPQRLEYFAEPVGTATGALVRQQDFVYQYRYPQATPQTVVGLAYEQTGPAADGTYVYAKYSLLTDFQYVLRQEIITVPNPPTASSQSRTNSRYNNYGRLAATGSQNSDGSYVRTRYKYLTDYALSGSSSDPLMQAMSQRLTAAPEQISSDVVETISEVVTAAGEVRFKGATLNTFKLVPATTTTPVLTRPYQVLRWDQLSPLPLSSTIDSTRLLNNALHISSNFKPIATITETDRLLRPLSMRTVAGRQVSGLHLGYSGTLPVLQIANAMASEVVFSDFETEKDYRFRAYSNSGNELTPKSDAARTGKSGMELPSAAYLLSPLPTSITPQYRLLFWAKAGQETVVDVTFTGMPVLASRTITVAGTQTWKLYELVFDWPANNASPRNGCNIKVSPRSTIHVDDVTLLPAYATSTSTTYDLKLGKSSETDSRGRTTYYDYNPAGELATVRDHNKAIVRQYEQVIAGRYQFPVRITPSFQVSGSLVEGDELTFTVDNNPSFGQSYTWNFGDGSPPVTTTANPTRHTFVQSRSYSVDLQVTNGQGKIYQVKQEVPISEKRFSITTCVAGIVAVDDCNKVGSRVDTSCNPAVSRYDATLSVQVGLPGPYAYAWEVYQEATASWVPTGATTASYQVPNPRSASRYRCWVTAGAYSSVSEAFGVEHYGSCNNTFTP